MTTTFDGLRRATWRIVEKDTTYLQLTRWVGRWRARLEQWRDAIERSRTRWRSWRAEHEPELDTAAAIRIEVDAWVQIQVRADLADRHLDEVDELYDCWAAAWGELNHTLVSRTGARLAVLDNAEDSFALSDRRAG
jgi:hypothetical protein